MLVKKYLFQMWMRFKCRARRKTFFGNPYGANNHQKRPSEWDHQAKNNHERCKHVSVRDG